jgi:spore maturation protein CgeB
MIDFKSHLKKWPLAAKINAKLKARSVERDAAAVYRWHETAARRRGIRVPCGVGLEAALRGRLAGRAHRLGWPKLKGDLHIFVAFGNWNWEAILPEALGPFGEISVFEWRARGYREERSDWLEWRDEMNRAMLAAFHDANERRPVDVVVGYLTGMTASPATLSEMASAGAAVTNFCFDDKHAFPGAIVGGRYPTTAAIASCVDLNLTSDPHGILKYAVHGGLAMFHPEAAHPRQHRPHPVPFEHDVSFIGANYGWRSDFIGSLERSGIGVSCFGFGWPNGPVSNEEMAKIYSRSRINLGFGGVGHSRKLRNLKGRNFEVTMSGGLYLTQDNPELSLVYDVGTEIITYLDEADCTRLIRELLADPKRAESVRRAGNESAQKNHTYEARWTTVLRLLGAMARDNGTSW